VASFIGVCRDANDGTAVTKMTLEHYPGMTEKALEKIVAEAKARWDVMEVLVIHRVGELEPADQIVLVVVTGAHRGEAFAACEFIMDYLKTRAPFWKKEETPQARAGSRRELRTTKPRNAGIHPRPMSPSAGGFGCRRRG